MQGKIILDDDDIQEAIEQYILNKYNLNVISTYLHYSSSKGETNANVYYDMKQLEGRKS